MRRSITAAIAIAVATVALPGAVRAAAPTTISCGDTITTSIVVANDLANCPGVGLQIGAAGVILNLAGYTLGGDAGGGGNGIDDSGGFGKLTVQNGSITGFASGISVPYGSNVKVAGVTSYANLSKGIVTDGTVGVTIQSSYTHGNPAAGIDVFENTTGTIKINGVASKGDGDGVETTGGPTTIDSSVFANEAGGGIVVASGGAYKITNNRVVSASGTGIEADGTGTISRNAIDRANEGINADGSQITKNTINSVDGDGIFMNAARQGHDLRHPRLVLRDGRARARRSGGGQVRRPGQHDRLRQQRAGHLRRGRLAHGQGKLRRRGR